jgi:hypothetical protein
MHVNRTATATAIDFITLARLMGEEPFEMRDSVSGAIPFNLGSGSC